MLIKRSSHTTRGHERGATIVLAALLMTSLMGMAAFVVDYGFARQATRNEQAASDAAALAAAQDLPKGNAADSAKADTARNTARKYSASSLADAASGSGCPAGLTTCTFTVGPHTVTVTTPYALPGSSIPSHNLVYVRACRSVPQFFAGVFGSGSQTVCRSSVARNRNIVSGFARGLITLNPTACHALEFTGSSTTNLYSNGAIIVESSCNPNALDGGGNAWEVQAGLITVVGGYSINPCTELTCLNGTTPITGVAPAGDPLAGVLEPAKPAAAPATSPGASPFTGQACTRYQPGSYSSININSGNACFAPGLYYIEAGSSPGAVAFRSNGNAFLHGQNVIFFIKRGKLQLNGTGSLRLTPPASGPYEGITLFQSRTNCAGAQINGNDNSSIGTIYLPCAHLDFQGNASAGQGDFVTGMVIADTVTITGNGNLTIRAVEPVVAEPPKGDLGLER